MKKFAAIIIVIGLIFSCAMPAYADGPGKKFTRGLANIGSSPLGIVKGMREVEEESGVIAAYSWGLLKGIGYGLKRLGVGIYEVVTFPCAMGRDYEPIIDTPEFFSVADVSNEPIARVDAKDGRNIRY